MRQHRKANGQRGGARRGEIDRASQRTGLAAGGFPVGIDFRQQPRQRAAAVKHIEHPRRVCLHQAARQLLPHPLGDQCVDLAGAHHVAHQRLRFGCHLEIAEARRETCDAQDAHRILGESR